MKEIKAIVQPFMASRVVRALHKMPGLPGVTVSEVRGFGRARVAESDERVVHDDVEYGRKTKLEIVVPDRLVEEVLEAIVEHARTGNHGDGKIFVSRIEDCVQIRTGVHGADAL